ncbi:MAG: hypothetical protein R6W73_03045 [Candidatus Saliniplasma sp.]
MISKEDPLTNLYVEKDEVDRLRLFLALKNYIGIDKSTGEPVFLEEFYDLSNKKKLVIYLLYRRAARALNLIKDHEMGIGIRDLSKILQIDYHKVKELVSEVEMVEKEKNKGRYYIPGDNLEEAINMLGHKSGVYYSTEKHTKKIK